MANYPKKTIDPTEAALSAIQEALNIQDEDEPNTLPPARDSDLPGGMNERRQPAGPIRPAYDDPISAEPIRSRDLGGPVAPAANDDQQTIGRILQTLQQRPAHAPYLIAGVFSAAWAIGCLALSWAYLSSLSASGGHATAALVIGLGAAALLPIIFFFGVAHMAWRGQELRLIAQSMAGLAMRLAEPESVARDSIVSVGQAIRREVAAMGDGVERALARASELENMVQNEVAALTHAYGENELRIRGLIQDLSGQRDRLVSQAEQVRSAINNVHIDLTQDLSTISDLVGQQVNEAAQRITNSLAEKGEHITYSLDEIGDNMIQQLSVRGSDLLKRLEVASAEASRAIATASDRLTSSLGFKTDHISEEFAEIAQGLEDMMTSRLDRVTDSFSERSLAIIDMMVGRSQELTDLVNGRAQELTSSIVETSSRIAETIATSTEEVSSTLKSSGESLVLDLNLRGGEVATKLEEAGIRITDSLVSRSHKMTETVRESAEHLVLTITSRSEEVKDLLSTRLAAYENMFNHSGVELGEKISRDAATLGNLITRHLSEFDRTVKTYGGELVERLGTRTQEVSESMRTYIDSFDERVTSRSSATSASLDERLTRFQEMLDGRTQTLTDGLSGRVMEIAKALADGGTAVVGAIEKRVSDVATVIDSGGQKIADTAGRAENVIREVEVRSRAAADLINARLVELSDSVKSSSANAERTLTQLLATTSETLAKSIAATSSVTEALNRSASEATASLNKSATTLSSTISKSAAAASDTIDKTTASSSDVLNKSATTLTQSISSTAAAASETLGRSASSATEAIGSAAATASDMMSKTARATADAIARSAGEAERTLVGMSSDVSRNIVTRADDIQTAVSQRVGEMTRALDEKSADMARLLDERSGELRRAIDEKSAEMTRAFEERTGDMRRAIDEKSDEMTRALDAKTGELGQTIDERSRELLASLTGKGQQFAGEVDRVTDQAVKAIEAKGFVFAQTMTDNSEEIARLINEASQNATTAVTRTLGQLQEGTQGVTESAKTTVARTLQELHNATRAAIEESKQTASATVADMLETHGMLRTDSTALFERLREANILLQEVLSGAHENMNAIEHTMMSRVSEFVSAMNDLNTKSGSASAKVEEQIGVFNNQTVKVLQDLGDLAGQFGTHGRSLAEAVELLEKSNRRTEETVTNRQANIETLVATLETRTDDFEQRLRRFSSLLDESLDSATTRAREIASVVAETSNESVHAIEQKFDAVRAGADEQRKRTSETLTALYQEASGQSNAMFNESAQRFTEVLQGMKEMAADMQRELETTRAELRRGILELPKETAESTAQMRRVIVDQIEALAELNRIVARHGRALDATEPVRREAEPVYVASSGGRSQPRPVRAESGGPTRPPRDITGAPTRWSDGPALSAVPGGKDTANAARTGWLSDLLTRASRDENPAAAPGAARDTARTEERPPREGAGSLESLSVDIARMIDHDAAAELWERYQRGERGVGPRRLYTAQGQKAFDEIRAKFRSDPEFRQTVEHYIHEFERLLEDVSRGDRGAAVARNYLTSDTGKVYTMLAHAAGRLDQ